MPDSENRLTCLAIAAFLHKELTGPDFHVLAPAPISSAAGNCVTFIKKYDEELLEKANSINKLLVIAPAEYTGKLACSSIISANPRLDFVRIIQQLFANPEDKPYVHPTAIIEDGAQIGENVSIGANCYIGSGVSIGSGTRLHHNVVVIGIVTIGRECIVKSGAVIGEAGFGFEYDETGKPVHFPHIGKIVIGDGVFIGANSTIERATINKTVLENNVKVDDLVQVGHNCTVGENTMIAAGSILCGGATIGAKCWIAPNVTIKEKLTVGDESFIGLGSVVIRNVEPGTVVAGVPAKELKKQT